MLVWTDRCEEGKRKSGLSEDYEMYCGDRNFM